MSRSGHWDSAYTEGDTTRSWYQVEPVMSLAMLAAAGVEPADSVIDVGGGASTLVDALLRRGSSDITVLDVSAVGIAHARQRLGADERRVQWLVADVLTWQPQRRYRVWHDRATFHFLTSGEARTRYVHTLDQATGPGSIAVFGCFAPDGPTHCSGLPVARYDASLLSAELGPGWALVAEDREEHRTPGAAVQPFTWAAFRRR